MESQEGYIKKNIITVWGRYCSEGLEVDFTMEGGGGGGNGRRLGGEETKRSWKFLQNVWIMSFKRPPSDHFEISTEMYHSPMHRYLFYL